MKLDFYISSLSSGGAEHVMTNLVKYFAAENYQVSLISYEKRPQFYSVDKRVNLVKYNNTEKNKAAEILLDLINTIRRLRRGKAEVAVSFLSRCNIMLIIAGLFSKTKIIVCDRNNLLKKYPKYVFKLSCFLYSFADAVVVQTHEIKKSYPKYLHKKIFVLENPLDFKEMQIQYEQGRLEASLENTVKKSKTVLSIGRLEKQKDFKTLIRAFKKVSCKFSDWELRIFGQGGMRKELEAYITRLNMEEKIKLCGVTHTPFFEMKRAEIFVLSSFYEGFPNVLCEAMHAGMACISTRCKCGPSEIIKNGENGYLVNIGDTLKLAERLEALMQDGIKRKRMGAKAEQSVEYLEINKVFLRWKEVIHKISRTC